MLSFKESETNKEIAIFTDNNKTKFLYLSDDINQKKIMPDNYNPLHYITIDEIRAKKKYISQDEIKEIISHLANLEPPDKTSNNYDKIDLYHKLLNIIFDRIGKTITIKNNTFEYIPQVVNGREIIYISGASGSGKSYFTSQYMKKYHKITNNDVILFTNVKQDYDYDNLFNFSYVKRINIYDNSLKTSPMTTDELINKLIIFDDVDNVDNLTQKTIDNLKKLILEEGRHTNTSCIITSHVTSNYAKTRTLISELHGFVCYPNYNSRYHLQRFLKIYISLDNDQINRIFNLKSRWVFISLKVPRFVLCENQCYILN